MRRRFLMMISIAMILILSLCLCTSCALLHPKRVVQNAKKAAIRVAVETAFKQCDGLEDLAIQDDEISFKVDHDTESFDVSAIDVEDVAVSFFDDQAKKSPITGVVNLKEGENVFYLEVASDNVFVDYVIKVFRKASSLIE